MARQYSMSWIASRLRWMKMYKGRRYVISCKALGVPGTKEGSHQAANRWWEAKKAELDGYSLTPEPGSSEAILSVLEKWAGRPLETHEDMRAAAADWMCYYSDKPLPDDVKEAILGPEHLTRTRARVAASFDTLDMPEAPPGRSITAHVEAWRRSLGAKVAAGLMSAARCANNLGCLEHLKTFSGPHADVDTLNAVQLQRFYEHCLGQVAARRTSPGDGWSLPYARDVFSCAKTFIRWLWEAGEIELPKNIGSKAFKFGNAYKAVKTWTPEEYKGAVAAAPGKLKLALLLMANCGMTQRDVSDLLDAEVDWESGRVVRQRSKTAGNENVPTVNYPLWPATFALLRQYRSGSERVLLTEGGLPYLRTRLKADGKLHKSDGFASSWVHVKKRLKLNRPLKQLRKLGATLLEGHPTYGRFVSYFLGHSPRTVKDRHYAQPAQELFDEAVRWIGQQLGQV
jgi:integrase